MCICRFKLTNNAKICNYFWCFVCFCVFLFFVPFLSKPVYVCMRNSINTCLKTSNEADFEFYYCVLHFDKDHIKLNTPVKYTIPWSSILPDTESNKKNTVQLFFLQIFLDNTDKTTTSV